MALVEFTAGDGTVQMIEVDRIAEFPRGTDGTCAYCHGDPCAERAKSLDTITQFYMRNPRAETCPCCDGRPT